ncbi:MAG TPA: hypothetical protein VLV83_09860, partial [Acidobacteriota bacterium]|nr:hypothetical protein [Acidobacteriota bacterium]
DLNPAGSGSFTATVSNNAYATASPSGNGFDLTTGAGTDNAVVLDFSGNTDITSSAGNGVVIDASTIGAGSLTITGFSGNSVNGATTGAGIVISNVTFDATPGGSLDQVFGGFTLVGSVGDAVGGAGMSLNNVTGDLRFTVLSIENSTGPGMTVAGSGPFAGIAGFRIAATGRIDSDAGPALNLDLLSAGLSFTSIDASGASGGVALTDLDGTVEINGGTINHSGGTGFLINGANAAVSYFGTITSTGGTAVEVLNRAGGSVVFNGQIEASGTAAGISASGNSGGSVTFNAPLLLSTGPSNAVNLTNNSGASFNIVGGLEIHTISGTGLNASQGSLSIFGANSINTVAGQALNLDTITSSGPGIIFGSVSASGSGISSGISIDSLSGVSTAITSLQVSSTSSANAVDLVNNTASISFGAASTIQNSGGTAFNVSGGSSNITYEGDIINTAGLSVAVTNTSSSLVNFTGTNTVTDSGDGISISSASNVTVAKANLSSGAVVDINSGSSGAAYTFSDLQINHTAGVNNAIDVDGGSATVSITANSTNNIISTTNRVLRVANTTGGSVSVNTGAGTLTDNGGGGIEIANADSAVTVNNGDLNGTQGISIANATTGAMTFNNVAIDVSGSAFIVNGSPGEVTSAIDLNNVDITNPGARVADIQNMNGGSVDFDASSALSTTSGTGIIVNSLAGTVPVAFDGPVDLGTGTGNRLSSQAITMSGNSAGTTLTFANLDVYTNNADGIDASGGGTLNATVGVLNSAGTGYDAALDLTGILSSVSVSDLDCSNNSNCVDLTSLAATSTTSFDDVNLTSTGGTAFSASSARTVTVTDADNDNTISASNAVGLSVVNTIIGAANMTWRSLSASGAANGLVLNNTGTTGGFTLAGAGGDCKNDVICTGGTISNTSTGVVLNSTEDVSLNALKIATSTASAMSMTNAADTRLDNVRIDGSGGDGVNGLGGGNVDFRFNNSHITNAGNDTNDDAFAFGETDGQTHLTGTVQVINSTITNFFNKGFRIRNTGGVLTMTVTGSTFSNSTEGQGLLLQADETVSTDSTMVLNVNGNSLFTNLRLEGIFANAIEPGTSVTTTVENCTFSNGQSVSTVVVAGGIFLSSDNGLHRFDLRGNTFDDIADGIAILNDKDGQMEGTIGGPNPADGNTFVNANQSDAITIRAEGASGTGNILTTVDIRNNVINGPGDDGMEINNRGLGNTGGLMQVTVRDNMIGTVANPITDIGILSRILDDSPTRVAIADNVFNVNDESMDLGAQDTSNLELTVTGNTVTQPNDDLEVKTLTSSGETVCLNIGGAGALANMLNNQDIEVTRVDGSTFELQGFAGSGTNAADVENFISGRNNSASTIAVTGTSPGFTADTCAVPSLPLFP